MALAACGGGGSSSDPAAQPATLSLAAQVVSDTVTGTSDLCLKHPEDSRCDAPAPAPGLAAASAPEPAPAPVPAPQPVAATQPAPAAEPAAAAEAAPAPAGASTPAVGPGPVVAAATAAAPALAAAPVFAAAPALAAAIAPAPAPASAAAPGSIAVQNNGNSVLQIGSGPGTYWVNDGIWGAANLSLGTYTGETGTTFEQAAGVGPNLGPNGEISWRMTWKWPVGTTEVKSYPSAISGNKPGCSNTWITPCGWDVKMRDGSSSQVHPSGPTPGTIFPMQLPIASLKSSFDYKHNVAPTGQGHLSYDIWLQNTPAQCHGFNNCGEITHEIMIPLNYWGGYGAYPARNPGWYYKDETIDGRLWHIYISKNTDGTFTESFFGGWKFIVFEPDGPVEPGTLDLSKFINYLTTQKDTAGTPWATNEHLVSVELGIEPVVGIGDMTVSNYRVWK